MKFEQMLGSQFLYYMYVSEVPVTIFLPMHLLVRDSSSRRACPIIVQLVDPQTTLAIFMVIWCALNGIPTHCLQRCWFPRICEWFIMEHSLDSL